MLSALAGRRSVPLLLIALAAACGDSSAGAEAPAPRAAALPAPEAADTVEAAVRVPAATPAPAEAVGPSVDAPANELGEILVLEYHRLGEPEGEFRRKPENFRRDLEALYSGGYRPVTVRQVLEGDLDLPRGTTPVVFTIDDSSLGQFYFTSEGSIDPATMAGMWDSFQQENPAWKGGATWCVLPAADHPSNFFGEKPSREVPREQREAAIQRKVDYLVDHGHEICNHTLYHARLDRARDDAQVQEWIGRGEDSIQVYLPEGYDVVTLALPLGQWPENRSLAWEGSWQERRYHYQGVLEVTGGPNPSPFHRDFDPRSINRFIVAPGHLERQLERYEEHPGRRFVSDGDPTVVSVPRGQAEQVHRDRIGSREVRLVDAPGDTES